MLDLLFNVGAVILVIGANFSVAWVAYQIILYIRWDGK